MFTIQDYPKSYGNIRQNFHRLKDFTKLDADIEKTESKFWEFIFSTASSKQPRKIFKSYQFINAGWEWSAFCKDIRTVIKIPSEIFAEVNDRKYLDNTKFAYETILDYFPKKIVAITKFKRSEGLNLLEQSYVDGKDNEIIGYNTKNLELLGNIKIFLKQALKMLNDQQWLPDFDIRRSSRGFRFRNVVFESNIPKIIAFTAYYDVYRLYPERTKKEVDDKARHIIDLIDWITKREKISKNTQGGVVLSRAFMK